MFIDTRQLDEGSRIEAQVCIIGGGTAGIAMALELDKQGIDTCVLESGGFDADDETRDLYRGDSVGLPYHYADGCRSRFLGGSTNCWGGWCRPFDEHDFSRRDWVANSGWPFGKDELLPYYERANPLFKIGPNNYDTEFWTRAIGRRDVRKIPLPTGKFIDAISQFSPPARFGKLYRDDLERSRKVRVYLYANVVDIETDGHAGTVTRLRLRTLTGRSATATARIFVLAGGGIENARLLLSSNKAQAAGLGNGHDLVGRYFMDHPRVISGDVRFTDQWARNKLYDVKFSYQNHVVAAFGTCVTAQFIPTEKAQREEGLLNSQVWFVSTFPGEYSPAADALIRIKQMLEKKDQPGFSFTRDMLTLMANPLDSAGFVMARLFQPRALIKGVRMQAIVEPVPDPNSRVTLSDRCDALGMRRASVAWRLDDQVKRTFDRTFALFAEEMERAGVASTTLAPSIEANGWPDTLHNEGTWHHMGTTRMHDSPRQGVVDRDCRVHGMTNLYVAGSSVFPTYGANFPTLTLMALALRLADRLGAEMARPDVELAAA